MAELKQVFEMVTHQIEPDVDAWKELEQRRRRMARNRKVAALAMVAVIMAAIALFAAAALNRGKDGSAPAVPPGESVPTFLSSKVVARAGHGNRAIGWCAVIQDPYHGVCTFWRGTGTLAGFHASVDVTRDSAGVFHWDGTYSFA